MQTVYILTHYRTCELFDSSRQIIDQINAAIKADNFFDKP